MGTCLRNIWFLSFMVGLYNYFLMKRKKMSLRLCLLQKVPILFRCKYKVLINIYDINYPHFSKIQLHLPKQNKY